MGAGERGGENKRISQIGESNNLPVNSLSSVEKSVRKTRARGIRKEATIKLFPAKASRGHKVEGRRVARRREKRGGHSGEGRRKGTLTDTSTSWAHKRINPYGRASRSRQYRSLVVPIVEVDEKRDSHLRKATARDPGRTPKGVHEKKGSGDGGEVQSLRAGKDAVQPSVRSEKKEKEGGLADFL